MLWYRHLYSLALASLTPIFAIRLLLRGVRSPRYLSRLPERFGVFAAPKLHQSVWVHAVSVGEFNAAIALIRGLMRRYPQRQFVITTVTPTGADRVRQVFGNQVFHCYLPYDLAGPVRRFLRRIDPQIAVIMETEIWPNLYWHLADRGTPIVIANARLSERSLRGYRPVGGFAALAIRAATAIAAQTSIDAERFIRLGARSEAVQVVGNLKFDLTVPAAVIAQAEALRARWGRERPVFIAASTHHDDEEPVLHAFAQVLRRFPDALLVLVPRHPERFGQALARLRQLGFRVAQRSQERTASTAHQCFLVDSMGELLLFYAAADVAFVGGSFAQIGGHNVLEACAFGKPVIVGPHTVNFTEVVALLKEHEALIEVDSGDALATSVLNLLAQPSEAARIGNLARQLMDSQRGALDRTLQLIDTVLAQRTGQQPAEHIDRT